MLDYFVQFFAYVIAFAVGSIAALLVARRVHPAASEADAWAALDAREEADR